MSKNLFELMNQQELHSNNFLPNKKEIQFGAKDFVRKTLEAGETDKTELFCQAVRLAEALEVVKAELKTAMGMEDFEAFGIKGQYRNGGETLNYSDDPIYSELQAKLKDRETLLKAAYKSREEMYDSEGIEVPKVSANQRKSSLTITF